MRRFVNGNAGQFRIAVPVAFSHLAHSFRRGWRRLGSWPSDFLWGGPLAGGGGPFRESQGDRGAQRRDAVARHRSREALPRRLCARNLAHAFHRARCDSASDGSSVLRRGLLQQARFDSRRSSAPSDSRPRTADCEHCRRDQSGRSCPDTCKRRSCDYCHYKSPYPPRSSALAHARSGSGPGRRARGLPRSLRSAALVAHHKRRLGCGA